PEEPAAPGPINIRDHLEQPEDPLPEVDLQQADDFQHVPISSLDTNELKVPNLENANPFDLQLPADSDSSDVPIDVKEPQAVENMDFLLNKEQNPGFSVEPPPTVTTVG